MSHIPVACFYNFFIFNAKINVSVTSWSKRASTGGLTGYTAYTA